MNSQRSDPDGQDGPQWIPNTKTAVGGDDFNPFSSGKEPDETTRYMAAGTQVDLSYARSVRRQLISDRFHALAPPYGGADHAVVARWALSALRRRFWCDVKLTTIFIAVIALYGIWLATQRSGNGWILALAAALLAAAMFWVVIADEFKTRTILVRNMRRDVFDTRGAPEPQEQRLIDRLAVIEARKEGNLVVFPEDSPFVGSGKLAHQWHLLLDVGPKSKPDDGIHRGGVRFSNTELHAKIVEALGSMGMPDTRVAERLFINGRLLQGHRKLVPQWQFPFTPPVSVDPANQNILPKAVDEPRPDARVYICAEMPSWKGQLGTTMFVRAVHTSGSLDIEWHFHVLSPLSRLRPPLSRLHPDIDNLHDESWMERLIAATWRGLPLAVPELVLAPFTLAWYGLHRIRVRTHRAVLAWEITRGRVFDYGAEPSIREQACGFGTRDDFIEHDQVMAIMLAQETLLQTIRDFLRDHDVDVHEFDGETQVVTYATEKNFNARNLPRTSVVVGHKLA